jgi:hypothetical protein
MGGWLPVTGVSRSRLQRALRRAQDQDERTQRRAARRAQWWLRQALEPARTLTAANVLLSWLACQAG